MIALEIKDQDHRRKNVTTSSSGQGVVSMRQRLWFAEQTNHKAVGCQSVKTSVRLRARSPDRRMRHVYRCTTIYEGRSQ